MKSVGNISLSGGYKEGFAMLAFNEEWCDIAMP